MLAHCADSTCRIKSRSISFRSFDSHSHFPMHYGLRLGRVADAETGLSGSLWLVPIMDILIFKNWRPVLAEPATR